MKIEELKKYIKETKTENFYFTGLKEKTIEEKYQYLKEHFNYDIMNSWNNLKTIANNVKIYNLGLTKEQEEKYFELMEIDAELLNFELLFEIENFEELTKTNVFFNGRSGGYIVMVPSYEEAHRNEHIFEWLGVDDILYCENYKEFKEEKNQYTGGYNYSYKNEIEEAYYYVKAFDKLCDILRAELIYILNNYKIETETVTETKEVKKIVI